MAFSFHVIQNKIVEYQHKIRLLVFDLKQDFG